MNNNMKLGAAVAIMVVVLAGSVFALDQDDSNALITDSTDLGTINVVGTSAVDYSITTNYQRFSQYDSPRDTMTVVVSDEDVTTMPETSTSSFVSVTNTGSNGNFTISLTGIAVGTAYVYAEYTVYYSVENQEFSQTMYYSGTVNVTAAGGTVTTSAIETLTAFTSYTLTPTYSINGTPVTDTSGYTFYAVGMPDGLSMANNGYIVGIPTATTETTYTVTIVMTDSVGTVNTGTTQITVVPATVDTFDYTLTYDGTQLTSPYVVITDSKSLILTMYNSGTTTEVTSGTVTIISSTGASQTVDYAAGGVTLNHNGTGVYQVSMTSGDVTQTFYLYVAAEVDDATASIIVT